MQSSFLVVHQQKALHNFRIFFHFVYTLFIFISLPNLDATNCMPSCSRFFFFMVLSLYSDFGNKPRRPYILLLTKILNRPDEVSGLSMAFLTTKYLYFPSCSAVTISLAFTSSLLHSFTFSLLRSVAPSLLHFFTQQQQQNFID